MKIISDKVNYISDYHSLDLSDINKLCNSYYFCWYRDYFIKIDNNIYFFKRKLSERRIFNELLGQYVSQYFGLENIPTNLVKDTNGTFSLITESFIREGHKYTTLSSGIFPNVEIFENDYININNLDNVDFIFNKSKKVKTDKKDLKKLRYKLKSMIISDFIRNQSDRVCRNFMFEYNKNHVKLMPLYDFEFSFLDYKDYLVNSFEIRLDRKFDIEYIKNDKEFQVILERAMLLEIKKIIKELINVFPIIIKDDEIKCYENIIKEKQNEIKKYKLI